MPGFRENEFLRALRANAARDPRLVVPLGDDAAGWRTTTDEVQLLAIDTVVAGTHVAPGPELPEQLARKAVRSNVSDIAAMGGAPEAVLVSMKLGPEDDAETAARIARTLDEECRRWGAVLVGGDTVVGEGGVVLTVAITGRAATPVPRNGARPGDVILATGSFGGSIIRKHVEFTPRVAEAARLVELGPPSALTDVSDGLARDVANIAEASGCGAALFSDRIPVSADARGAARRSGRDALHHALHDGEDFELVLTLAPGKAEAVLSGWNMATPLTVVGEVVAEGLWLDVRGERLPLEAGGWEHGTGARP